MNPEPALIRVQSIFAVPEHIGVITLGGGCGESHLPLNGAVDCALCAAVVTPYSFGPAPAAEPSPEQPVTSPDVPATPAAEAAAPAADLPAAVADSPSGSKSKRTDTSA